MPGGGAPLIGLVAGQAAKDLPYPFNTIFLLFIAGIFLAGAVALGRNVYRDSKPPKRWTAIRYLDEYGRPQIRFERPE